MKRYSSEAIIAVVGVVLVAAGLSYWLLFAHKKVSINVAQERAVEQTRTEASAPESSSTTTSQATETFVIPEKPKEVYHGEKVTASSPEKLPSSNTYSTFHYDSAVGKTIAISGTCSDAYYAIVVFQAKDDYRKNPPSAVMNQAFACPKTNTFTASTDLKQANLPTGEYYFFIADQGKTGTWYNPR